MNVKVLGNSSRLTRRSLMVGSLASAAVVSGVTHAGARAVLQEEGAPTGEIIVGETAFWNDLNPLTLSDAKGLELFITEPLVIYSREDWSQLLPGLAESWTVSDDGLIYTFTLRSTASFTDGTPFTAQDVKFTFDTAKLAETGYSGPVPLASVGSVDVVSDIEVKITLTEVSAVFLQTLSRFGIVAKHLLEGQDLKTTDYRQFPVGTGPFLVKEHTAEFFTLEANPDYWGDPAGVQRVIFKTAPDAAARSAMLRAGEIDLTRFEPQTQADLVGDGFHVDSARSLGWLSCEINHANPLFADKQVRKAMLHALDREGILGVTYQGVASVASGPIVPEDPFFDAETEQYPFDLEKAAGLMEAAGWSRNGDGVWEKEGATFAFALMAYQPNPGIYNTNLALQESWNQFGFDVEVDVAPDWPSWWDRYIANDFAAGVMDWGYGMDPDGMSGSFATGGGANGSGYTNPEVDELLGSGRATLDPVTRKGIYSQVQRIVADDLPTLWLAWQSRGIIMQDGVTATYNPIGDFYANAYWWRLEDA